MAQSNSVTRREFVKTASTAEVASLILPNSSFGWHRGSKQR